MCFKRGALSVHKDVDVTAEFRRGVAQSIAHAGPALIQSLDRLSDGGGADRQLGIAAGEQAAECRGQGDDDRVYPSMTKVSTDKIGGRWCAMLVHCSPSLALANSVPVFVPA